ncbi:hypothetical protein BT63DRAFT_440881 [Microthyrium microscopicum]|uniref:Uncharacterized protein n=1 Tax=Microthyrium microscopicum TaxID=703497 RepID=A0A6A6UBT9_9PEZI|nr:hypothetical protein BT63DRAFT_440881 [Microthyrium microscopicum]
MSPIPESPMGFQLPHHPSLEAKLTNAEILLRRSACLIQRRWLSGSRDDCKTPEENAKDDRDAGFIILGVLSGFLFFFLICYCFRKRRDEPPVERNDGIATWPPPMEYIPHRAGNTSRRTKSNTRESRQARRESRRTSCQPEKGLRPTGKGLKPSRNSKGSASKAKAIAKPPKAWTGSKAEKGQTHVEKTGKASDIFKIGFVW